MKVCHFREDFRQKNWRQKNGKSFTCLDQKLDCDLELIFSPFFCLQFFCLESFLLALSAWFRLRRPGDRRALPAITDRLTNSPDCACECGGLVYPTLRMKAKLITVVPVYNGAEFIEQALQSVAA